MVSLRCVARVVLAVGIEGVRSCFSGYREVDFCDVLYREINI